MTTVVLTSTATYLAALQIDILTATTADLTIRLYDPTNVTADVPSFLSTVAIDFSISEFSHFAVNKLTSSGSSGDAGLDDFRFSTRLDDIVIGATEPDAIPEPTTMAMLLGGFGILLGFQRARRRA